MIGFLPRWLNLANKFAAENEQVLRAFAASIKGNLPTALGPGGYEAQIRKADGFGSRTDGAKDTDAGARGFTAVGVPRA